MAAGHGQGEQDESQQDKTQQAPAQPPQPGTAPAVDENAYHFDDDQWLRKIQAAQDMDDKRQRAQQQIENDRIAAQAEQHRLDNEGRALQEQQQQDEDLDMMLESDEDVDMEEA